MTLSQFPRRLSGASALAYGEPIVTKEGATVLPVSRVRGDSATPIGVFVVQGGQAVWTPAVDSNRIAQIGVWTGFAAASLACLALVRRPPWPDTIIHVAKSG